MDPGSSPTPKTRHQVQPNAMAPEESVVMEFVVAALQENATVVAAPHLVKEHLALGAGHAVVQAAAALESVLVAVLDTT